MSNFLTITKGNVAIMKFNFATVGTSRITEEFINTAKLFPEFYLKGVYSRSIEKADKFAELFQADNAYDDLEELASNEEIDAVYIASPNSFHMSQSILFMENKKHVLCEKPAASNHQELEQILQVAEKNQVLFMEAYKSILIPGFSAITKNLSKLGKIRSAYINYSKYSSRYDAHKLKKDVNTFKAEFSNGSLMDLGVYCLYPIIYLFGEPIGIKASAAIIPDGVDGVGAMILEYLDFIVTLNYGKVSNSYLPCEIQGENATMLIDKFNIPENVEIIYRDPLKENVKYQATQRAESMYYEIEEFLQCLKLGKIQSKINTHELSMKAMKIMDEARSQCGIVYPADHL